MNCRLCLQSKPLIRKAHIISNFLYSPLKDINNTMISVDRGSKNKPMTVCTGEFERGLFCADCDNKILGSYESYASKIINAHSRIKEIRVTIFKDGKGLEKYARIGGVDYKKFKLFLLSILWRSSISERKFFENIKLGLQQERVLRKMLLEGNPGHFDDYPCVILIPRKQRLLGGIMRQPLINKGGYQFLIAGVFYFFYIAKPLPSFVAKNVIREDGSMNLIFMTDEWADKFENQIIGYFFE